MANATLTKMDVNEFEEYVNKNNLNKVEAIRDFGGTFENVIAIVENTTQQATITVDTENNLIENVTIEGVATLEGIAEVFNHSAADAASNVTVENEIAKGELFFN